MATCKACEEPLVLNVEHDIDEEDEVANVEAQSQVVPDDLELPCGCHFHWQCLLDDAPEVTLSLKCPSCQTYLPVSPPGPSAADSFPHTTGTKILTRYNNEGGLQEVDILPFITEEAYLDTNPDARPARSFHVMCSQGDVEGIVELLRGVAEESDNSIPRLVQLLCYQDPLSHMKSGLHLAAERSQTEVAWLLLWVVSTLSVDFFPQEARQLAESMQLGRLPVGPDQDIRGLQDDQGQTAYDVASRIGGLPLLEADVLRL